MKLTLSWLKRFLDTDASIDDICNALTQVGIEVESVISLAATYDQFIVVKVFDVQAHPNADKLSVCKVSDGQNTLTIVTGASNVRDLKKGVLAPLGSTVGKVKMERRALRGIESEGMLCSGFELNLNDQQGGLLAIDDDVPEGTLLSNAIPGLDDFVIEVSITPNRGDCLGVYGIARDLAAYGIGELKPIEYTDIKATIDSPIKATVKDTHDCPLYLGRYFANVTNGPSPAWLQILLRSIGDTPISALVDITNYISYSFARPMHVYDADAINGDVEVRKALPQESFTDLDGKQHTLSPSDIVIADQNSVLGLAGIMGGDASKCTLESRNVYLEAAVFDPIAITKMGRRCKINTDARRIFERGVDHNFTRAGICVASQLIQEICGGQASNIDVVGKDQVEKKQVVLDTGMINSLSGVAVSQEQALGILEKLGFEIELSSQRLGDLGERLREPRSPYHLGPQATGTDLNRTGSRDIGFLRSFGPKENLCPGMTLSVPTWRHDISIPEDLVEEVLRIYGYDKIQARPFSSDRKPLPLGLKRIRETGTLLSSIGYTELVTYSFIPQALARHFGVFADDLLIQNPISPELDTMRQSLMPNLLQAIKQNNARSISNLAFFEAGITFASGQVGDQRMCIAACRSGKTSQENLYKDSRSVDFFDAKGAMLDVLQVYGISEDELEIDSTGCPKWYHPGKSMMLKLNGELLGYCGEIHPAILEQMKLDRPIVGFEFYPPVNTRLSVIPEVSLSNYQPVRRDFAFIVDSNVPARALLQAIKSADKELIRDAHLFDVYQGDGLEAGKKSLAVRVTLQASDRTLSSEDITNTEEQIILAVQTQTSGKLRN